MIQTPRPSHSLHQTVAPLSLRHLSLYQGVGVSCPLPAKLVPSCHDLQKQHTFHRATRPQRTRHHNVYTYKHVFQWRLPTPAPSYHSNQKQCVCYRVTMQCLARYSHEGRYSLALPRSSSCAVVCTLVTVCPLWGDSSMTVMEVGPSSAL